MKVPPDKALPYRWSAANVDPTLLDRVMVIKICRSILDQELESIAPR